MDEEEYNAYFKRERRRAVLAFTFAGPMCLCLIFLIGYVYYERALLIADGVVDTGRVSSYKPSICGSLKTQRTCHYHQIYVPNLGSISLDLGKELQVSSPVIVTYQKSDKSNFRAGNMTSVANFNFTDLISIIGFLMNFWFVFLLSKNFINALIGKLLD